MSKLTTEGIARLEEYSKQSYCARVASFRFPDSSLTKPQDGEQFWFAADQDLEWIVVIKDGKEIARHNVRLIASIYWGDESA